MVVGTSSTYNTYHIYHIGQNALCNDGVVMACGLHHRSPLGSLLVILSDLCVWSGVWSCSTLQDAVPPKPGHEIIAIIEKSYGKKIGTLAPASIYPCHA